MATVINLSDATPSPPAGKTNVKWQADSGAPRNVSAYLPVFVGDSGSGGASGSVPAPAAGDAAAGKILRAGSGWDFPGLGIGFVIGNVFVATDVGPMLTAPHSGVITKCVVVVKSSDASVNLTFTIKKNGTTIFATDPTLAAGTSSATVTTFTSLTSNPLSVSVDDVFTIDISSGNSSWKFTAHLG